MAHHEHRASREELYLASAQAHRPHASTDEILEWLAERHRVNDYQVSTMPLADLRGWTVEPETGNLRHESGRFFSVEGVDVATDFGPRSAWKQPIINQPEIGIVGFVTQEIDGVLHFLVQAKMEPGNVNYVQLSPTVQATHSNYTGVHGGTRTPYVEYFLDSNRARVLVNQLQSEQGTRFFRKRNRNMIVRVPSDDRLELRDNYHWVTLHQLGQLSDIDNVVNMDSRSVLSAIRFVSFGEPGWVPEAQGTTFSTAVFESSIAPDSAANHEFESVVAWFADMRARYRLSASLVPLKYVQDWHYDGVSISHRDGRDFSVVGVDVVAAGREVGSWQQPLIDSAEGGVVAFVCQRQSGVLHLLVQALVEPGTLDIVELAPTVQCLSGGRQGPQEGLRPVFYDLVCEAGPQQIRYDRLQSEEGGRFYHDQNRYLVVEVDERDALEIPENYCWVTIRQLKEFVRFNNCVNIEARSLIACVGTSAGVAW